MSTSMSACVDTAAPLGVAVIGAGYWGPNLIRNVDRCASTVLRWVCDLDEDRARAAVGRSALVGITSDLDVVLNDPEVAAVAIATPAHTHLEIALAAIDAGKHVLVEKPLAASVAEGEKLVDAAERAGVVLMCDHTYCFTPAVEKIGAVIAAGDLGEIRYIDSVRINLGLVQPDVDVFWDLAPHDLSILDYILPADARPVAVAAQAADPLGVGHPCVGYLTLPLANGGIAHAHVNWLSPTKVRTTCIGGSKQMLVWDDLNPAQRVSMYDTGVELRAATGTEADRISRVSYRTGDMVAPALPEREALGGVITELAAAVAEQRAPRTDGRAGLRVLRILEAAGRSLDLGGAAVPLPADVDTAAAGVEAA